MSLVVVHIERCLEVNVYYRGHAVECSSGVSVIVMECGSSVTVVVVA